VVIACLAIRQIGPTSSASAKPPAGAPAKKAAATAPVNRAAQQPAEPAKPQPFVATVNGEQIRREDLARECLRHYGEEVLEALVNKQLIGEECARRKLAIDEREVDAEIDRLARKFSLPKEQYLKLLEKERQVRPAQYREMIWLTLALRKLAAEQLNVSRDEIDRAFESQFGPAVKARLIAIKDPQKAKKIHALAVAKPEQFGALARQHSDDTSSASVNGLIQPIRRHLGDPALEQAAFALKPGEISPVLKVAGQHVFLKCEGWIEPPQVDRKRYEPTIVEAVRERKLRTVGAEVFRQIQSGASIENVWNNPAKRQARPGVAALVNGREITIDTLATACLEQHGHHVLTGTINRRLLEQAVRRRKITVAEADLNQEITRAALAHGKTTKSGKPDIEGWIEQITKEQGISREVYLHDSVWPTVALKKLVENDKSTVVTEEDVRKGFEANYGRRVRCRAIVLPSQRKAQEVWEMARRAKDAEQFGDLAEKYSIETTSKHLKGEVPPIQRHGGEPSLEKAAFELQPGQISGIIQLADNWVILFCEGFTEPVKVKPEEVRQLVMDDVREKKLRVAMAKTFEQLKESATIDNYLTGVSKAPKKRAEEATAARPGASRK
jgi:parvulin-like peptidyl-prolyl isomerase